MTYDSKGDTVNHIKRVREHIEVARSELQHRALLHDWTKLHEPEKSAFDNAVGLKTLEYGTAEYDAAKNDLGSALQHHYQRNRHHPEHFPNGITDMNLIDMLEMLCDWKAASERMKDGDMQQSLRFNKERFHISDELYAILERTAKDLGFI